MKSKLFSVFFPLAIVVVGFSFSANATLQLLKNIRAVTVDESFGTSASSIKDLNGDGVPDLVVGAPRDPTSHDAGKVYVVSGVNGTLVGPGIIQAPAGQYNFGLNVLVVGDQDLLGKEDFAVVALAQNSNFRGIVTVFSSETGQPIGQSFQFVDPWSTFQDQDRFGSSMSRVPDLDGDNRDEFLIGAPGASSVANHSGAAGLYGYNPASGTWVKKLRLDFIGIFGTQAQPGDEFGASVACIGDVNADQVPDFAVGIPAFGAGLANPMRGGVVIFSGQLTPGGTQVPATVLGYQLSTKDEEVGRSIAALGDITGDGKPEFVVGAPYMQTIAHTGIAYGGAIIYSGASVLNAGPGTTFPLTPFTEVMRAYPQRAGGAGNLGMQVVGSAYTASGFTSLRLDKDQKPDFILSAPSDAAPLPSGGGMPWFWGAFTAYRGMVSPNRKALRLDKIFGSQIPSDGFGEFMALANDMNGDGRADIIAGFPEGNSQGGRVLIFGP